MTNVVVSDGNRAGLSEEGIAQLEKECFITPVILPEGRLIVIQDAFRYSGRLVIPDTAKKRPTTGHVVRVNDIEVLGDLIGKRIVFGMWSGTALDFKNRPSYRVLDSKEVLGIVELEDVELDKAD